MMERETKILIVTNMRPSPQKPYSGIFVQNQFNRLKEDPMLDLHMFSMERTFTSKLGSATKYFCAFIKFIPFFFRKYDVIHLHYFFPLIIPVYLYSKLHRKAKIVVTFHGSDINERVGSYNKLLFRYLSGCIHYTVSVGRDLGEMIRFKLNLKPDIILSAGIDERIFRYIEGVEKKFHFTFSSSFVPRKGLDIFIEAITQLGNKNIKFCFVGSGILEDNIRQLAEDYDVEIKLNLTQEEMCMVFNQSYFHVLPSRFEPFGLVVTESMFCGTPSIVSNTGGIKDQIQHGETGFILQDLTANHLEKVLEYCYSLVEREEYKILHENCLKANKEHNLSNVTDITKAIYTQLLA